LFVEGLFSFLLMRTNVAGHAIEVTRPESPKFRHPLLLLHGLWTDAWIWERFATYLAHRGWESWAPSLNAAMAVDPALALDALVAALPATPVIVAHDVAILAAAAYARRAAVPALIAIAPVVAPADLDGARNVLVWPQFWRARLFGARVTPPRGSAAQAFLGDAITQRARLRDDSGPAFRAIASGRVRLPTKIDVPGLVVGGTRDVAAPEAALRALAARFGWAQRAYGARGHFPMLEPGWEGVADDVHRWIVQALGADLLAFLDEDPL
jgi:pimeloyl-ACP methyl ester carboxylesterase